MPEPRRPLQQSRRHQCRTLKIRSTPAARWLLTITFIQLAALLMMGLLWIPDKGSWPALQGLEQPIEVLALLSTAGMVHAAWRVIRERRNDRERAAMTTDRLDRVLATGKEWLWSINADGVFDFCGPASDTLLGYQPAELIGQPIALVIDPGALATARTSLEPLIRPNAGWDSLIVDCRHRDGTTVWVEVSGRIRLDEEGCPAGFEGTSRALGDEETEILAREVAKQRIETMLAEVSFLTAFQPIHDLQTGAPVGAEALTRFLGDPGRSPDIWFDEAFSVGLGTDLELLAVQTALCTAMKLPEHLYISVNVSPATCMDPRFPDIIRNGQLPPARLVLEITEHVSVVDYAPVTGALRALRRSGVRIAVDDTGSGYASMRHILKLHPDFIKIDRSIISGIDTNAGQRALGLSMVSFAGATNAYVIAEGIETRDELTTVTELGMTAGQGYFLGRPSVNETDWEGWHVQNKDRHFIDRETPPNGRLSLR